MPTGKRVELLKVATKLFNEAEPGSKMVMVPPEVTEAKVLPQAEKEPKAPKGLPSLTTTCDLEVQFSEVVGWLRKLTKTQLAHVISLALDA